MSTVDGIAFDGIVLAGGAGRRLGGVAKPLQELGSRRLLDVAVDALTGAGRVVVVGPVVALDQEVNWVREDPPGGGPVAALDAALPVITAATVVVLAADLAFVTADAVGLLVERAPVVAVDDDGRDQPLLAAYRSSELRSAMPAQVSGARLGGLVAAMPGVGRMRLPGHPPPWWDCDTPAELQRAREWHDAG